MDLDNLLRKNPQFHQTGKGELISYGLGKDTLAYIAEKIADGSRTLETGAGHSTILFALLGARHICVVPQSDEVDRIIAFCREYAVPLDKVQFIVQRSEMALPTLKADPLDLVLIDGNHAFPAPFIDWYYTADKIKVGGLLIIDDTEIWTGRILRNFLLSEPEWRLDREFSKRASSFLKIKDGGHLKGWGAQRFVKRHSYLYFWEFKIWSIWAIFTRLVRKIVGN
jgi:hypothetical protein